MVDSSALLAVFLDDEDRDRYLDTMLDATGLNMSAGSWLETGIVVDNRKDPVASMRLEDLRSALRIAIAPVTLAIADRGRAANMRYGRDGRPARLNYGDCFAYALAKETGEPLLFKGDDFAQTDIEPVLKD
jgi:ribonuclease VapC